MSSIRKPEELASGCPNLDRYSNPRTLHMSYLGNQGLSVIETPPTNRYPVRTYVLEKNDSVIRDAILREMGVEVSLLPYNKVEH